MPFATEKAAEEETISDGSKQDGLPRAQAQPLSTGSKTSSQRWAGHLSAHCVQHTRMTAYDICERTRC